MPTPAHALVEGQKVRYLPQPEWGVGHLEQLLEDGAQALVRFPGRDESVRVSTKGGALVAHAFAPGERAADAKGRTLRILREEEGARGLRRYAVAYDGAPPLPPGEDDDELPETELRALPAASDFVTLLREGRAGDAKAFLLRRQALVLDDERRCDALGALLASRVMVKPHQVGVVQRVLSARAPRFVLADEVGLGKTIEAGMAFSALRLSGLARRVLVVAPSHLTVQWLAELFHKFNQLFTLMDTERYQSSLREAPDVSPWARFPLVVTSLEMLARTAEHRAQAGAPDAYWDLVVIDEAHHLKGEKAYEAARALAKNSWGLLLLTATPMQLDPAEYQALLASTRRCSPCWTPRPRPAPRASPSASRARASSRPPCARCSRAGAPPRRPPSTPCARASRTTRASRPSPSAGPCSRTSRRRTASATVWCATGARWWAASRSAGCTGTG
jgi:ATP-dependent helicase HepA